MHSHMRRTAGIREERGLTQDEVLRSREEHGSNALTAVKRRSFVSKYLESFQDPIIRILLIALAVNFIMLLRSQNWYEFAGIAAAIVVATMISTISERSNESAFEKLQKDAAQITCRVRRAEGLIELPIDEIVVGDVISLQTGDKVPADGAMIFGELRVDQSALNGESKEARKAAESSAKALNDFLSVERVFRGSVVCSGEGEFRADAVGGSTFYGKLAHEVQREGRESPLKIRLETLAGTISKLGYIGAALVAVAFMLNVFALDFGFNTAAMMRHFSDWRVLARQLLQVAILAVTVIVVAVPEGLPMMITVVLSGNMKRMLRDNVLVRKLTGIETAGSLNILFTDKTGTLTQGRLRVNSFCDGAANEFSGFEQLRKTHLWPLVYASVYCNNQAEMTGQGITRRAIGGNGTDRALLEAVEGMGEGVGTLIKTTLAPFSSKTKFSAVRVSGSVKAVLVKGSPDKLLPLCKSYYDASGKLQPFDNQLAVKRRMGELSSRALRLIALCTSESAVTQDRLPHDLALVGLVAIRDEVRPEAVQGVLQVQRAGVQVVMVTGDSRETATAIARETGILQLSNETVLTSDELARLSDDEVKATLPSLRVVARALPSDKSRLVRLSQEAGQVVGMTGDGVNDAPALTLADVGFAMGSGTEVAKEAGSIVILDDNICSIAKAILYGRTIFKSIRKFIIFQLTVNLCAVGLSVLGPLLGIDHPVTVLQMLWINMVMDTLAGLAFSGEPPLARYMQEPPKKRDEPIMNRYMTQAIVGNGLYSVCLMLAFLKLPALSGLVRQSPDNRYLMTAFFGLFIFLAIANAFCARTERRNVLADLGRNRLFMLVMAAVIGVQLLLLYFGGTLFRTAGLAPRELLLIIGLAATVVPADALRKWLMRKISVADAINRIRRGKAVSKSSYMV